jgi:hypothetical protein
MLSAAPLLVLGFFLNSEDWGPLQIAGVVVGVLAFTAMFIWLLWRMAQSVERAEREPRYLRRILFILGGVYVAGAINAIIQVLSGNQPLEALVGLPIGALLAWFYLRTAFRVKLPK